MKNLILVLILLLESFSASAIETAPLLINYQGRLSDANGAIPDGTYSLEFNIYDAATSGTKVWGPQVFTAVPVINGMFNVILGEKETDINGMPIVDGKMISSAFTGSLRYLGITVGIGSEVTPRQQILSAPYSISTRGLAVDQNNSLSGIGIVPVGTIMAWHKSFTNTPTLPDGWVECNGQVISDPNSPYINQTVPNLNFENRFLRGGATSGSLQDDAFQGHSLGAFGGIAKSTIYPTNHPPIVNGYSGTYKINNITGPNSAYGDSTDLSAVPNGVYGTPRVATETRPKNMSVIWIMRIK